MHLQASPSPADPLVAVVPPDLPKLVTVDSTSPDDNRQFRQDPLGEKKLSPSPNMNIPNMPIKSFRQQQFRRSIDHGSRENGGMKTSTSGVSTSRGTPDTTVQWRTCHLNRPRIPTNTGMQTGRSGTNHGSPQVRIAIHFRHLVCHNSFASAQLSVRRVTACAMVQQTAFSSKPRSVSLFESLCFLSPYSSDPRSECR